MDNNETMVPASTDETQVMPEGMPEAETAESMPEATEEAAA